ncbi:phage holin family protein [Nocardiopsis sediminis]|uniref:Phage holin family protein n=1 Tax=Nocardiopsis sediminis TaxID=1778267 RepID=A0ABV8FYY6_9ACTN
MPETRSGGQESEDFDAAERSLGELFSDAGGNVSRLIRLELELAKLEIARDASQIARGSVMFIGAAVMAHMVLVLASITLGLGLWALGLAAWLAFLIVTVLYVLLAGLLVFLGNRRLKKIQGLPRTGVTMARTMAVLRREHPADF